ncbi:hypothetical protein [Azospirillum sp. TSO22-1]|uniref:hypothetical protein n=1 Tax=Azospirillum sp. TSO22-1 TaxID=716789 RepID=UPI000D60E627|nr:hypothetical protein [Azospirillum sp. TSO22-1]PWC53277.1 hypothetical protein TSO221_11420 [Azospirillum sp. TSO22-1]
MTTETTLAQLAPATTSAAQGSEDPAANYRAVKKTMVEGRRASAKEFRQAAEAVRMIATHQANVVNHAAGLQPVNMVMDPKAQLDLLRATAAAALNASTHAAQLADQLAAAFDMLASEMEQHTAVVLELAQLKLAAGHKAPPPPHQKTRRLRRSSVLN